MLEKEKEKRKKGRKSRKRLEGRRFYRRKNFQRSGVPPECMHV